MLWRSACTSEQLRTKCLIFCRVVVYIVQVHHEYKIMCVKKIECVKKC